MTSVVAGVGESLIGDLSSQVELDFLQVCPPARRPDTRLAVYAGADRSLEIDAALRPLTLRAAKAPIGRSNAVRVLDAAQALPVTRGA